MPARTTPTPSLKARSWFPLALSAAVVLVVAFSTFSILQWTDKPTANKAVSTAEQAEKAASPKAHETKPDPERATLPRDLGQAWWEQSRLIYHGIPARIKLHLPEKNTNEIHAVFEQAWKGFDHIGQVANAFNPESELGRFNASKKDHPLALSGDLAQMLTLSQTLFTQSNGAFDPTIWPLKTLWKNAVKTQVPPSQEDIDKALKSVGFANLKLKEATAQSNNEGLRLDLGGLAKGYAVDHVQAIVRRLGAKAGLVQLGGEISSFGANRDAAPWRFGVQDPKNMQALWATVSSKRPLKVSTSGNYRQPLKIAGTSYYHIFNPKTGWPVDARVLGVTTLDAQGKATNALLDGAATAMTVLGPEKSLALAESLGIDALILSEENGAIRSTMTPGFSRYRDQP